jgi:excisionase family DNA binding protein
VRQLLTPREVADLARLTVDTVYRFAKRGTLLAVKIGRHLRFREEDIARWLAGPRPALHKRSDKKLRRDDAAGARR